MSSADDSSTSAVAGLHERAPDLHAAVGPVQHVAGEDLLRGVVEGVGQERDDASSRAVLREHHVRRRHVAGSHLRVQVADSRCRREEVEVILGQGISRVEGGRGLGYDTGHSITSVTQGLSAVWLGYYAHIRVTTTVS